jgi:hypothetical protein
MSRSQQSEPAIRGWLLAFVISYAAIKPAFELLVVTDPFDDELGSGIALATGRWTSGAVGEWAIALATIALCWLMVALLLLVRKGSTIWLVIAGIWLGGVGRDVAELLLLNSLFQPVALDAKLLRDFVFPIVTGSLWTGYFLRSRRVAKIYFSDRPNVQLGEIFS